MNLPRYEIISELGQGKSGITYLAKDKHLPSQRLCAVKRFKPKTNDPKLYELIKERFIEEARHLENLCKRTDQVPELYEFYIGDGNDSEIYLIEQWIAGKTVAQRLMEKEPITAPEVRDIVTNLLLVLETLRSEGIIHRDIKPENIILRASDGKPILIDFGVVKEVISTYTTPHGSPSTTSIIAGTAGYIAPEQLIGRPVFSSDLYSVGMTVIHLLTRRHPLDLHNTNGEITWREYSPTVSDEFAVVINKAIERDHLHRYASAAEMLAALKNCPESRFGSVQINTSDKSTEISSFSVTENSTLIFPSNSTPVSEPKTELHTAAEHAVDIAIEIGNDFTRIFRKKIGVILSEPTVVAVNRFMKTIEAVGRKGEDLLFISEDELEIVTPIKDCKVQHRRLLTRMLAAFFTNARVLSSATRVVMPITSQLSQTNRNAVIQSLLDAGASEVFLVDAATCAAMSGSVQAKDTSVIVHVGESSTEVMVIKSGRKVLLKAVSTGTREMRDLIIYHLKRRHNLLISKRTAETIWTNVGCAYPLTDPISGEVLGRNLIEGIPKTITITDGEVCEALSASILPIINTVRLALEAAPPELAADIFERGLLLTGRGALLSNLDKRLSIETGMRVVRDPKPDESMLAGAARMLSDFNLTPDGVRPTDIVRFGHAVMAKARNVYGALVAPFCRPLAMDVGAANTHIYAKDRGIIVSEPSIVAVDVFSKEIVASGRKAKEMLSHGNFKIIHPIRDGRIDDPTITKLMLRHFLLKASPLATSRPQIVLTVPVGLSQVERDAFKSACEDAGAYNPVLVANSISAATGEGFSVEEPTGSMVVDVGAATTSVSVISSAKIVYSREVLVAGWLMDESIIQYLKRKYNLLIGERTAEAIKFEMGSAYPLDEPLTMEVRGRNLIEGIPKVINISDEEIREALMDCLSTIINAVRIALERTPPELSADIFERGILLTGGGALLRNFDKRLSIETGLPVIMAEDPLASSVLGVGRMLSDRELLKLSILHDEFV